MRTPVLCTVSWKEKNCQIPSNFVLQPSQKQRLIKKNSNYNQKQRRTHTKRASFSSNLQPLMALMHYYKNMHSTACNQLFIQHVCADWCKNTVAAQFFFLVCQCTFCVIHDWMLHICWPGQTPSIRHSLHTMFALSITSARVVPFLFQKCNNCAQLFSVC